MSNVEVSAGQVWADKDPRAAGRTIEVMRVDLKYAFVRMNTRARNVSQGAIGRKSRILLSRFGADYALSDVERHRIGRHKVTGELGYHPMSELQQNQP